MVSLSCVALQCMLYWRWNRDEVEVTNLWSPCGPFMTYPARPTTSVVWLWHQWESRSGPYWKHITECDVIPSVFVDQAYVYICIALCEAAKCTAPTFLYYCDQLNSQLSCKSEFENKTFKFYLFYDKTDGTNRTQGDFGEWKRNKKHFRSGKPLKFLSLIKTQWYSCRLWDSSPSHSVVENKKTKCETKKLNCFREEFPTNMHTFGIIKKRL